MLTKLKKQVSNARFLFDLSRNCQKSILQLHNDIDNINSNITSIQNLINQILNIMPQVIDASNYENYLRELFDKLDVSESDSLHLKRFGNISDGGYVLDSKNLANLTLISIGIGDEVSFERELQPKLKAIYAYDPTIDLVAFEATDFFKIGILGGKLDQKINFLESLSSILERYRKESLILKIDAEGAEWTSLTELDDSYFQNIHQLVVEFHDLHRVQEENFREISFNLFEKLNKYFFPVHLNNNNHAKTLLSESILITDSVEISFLNKATYQASEIVQKDKPLNGKNALFRLAVSDTPIY